MTRTTTTLTELARIGFADLGGASEALAAVPGGDRAAVRARPPIRTRRCGSCGTLREAAPDAVGGILKHEAAAQRLLRVLGASEGIGGVPRAASGAAGGAARSARGAARPRRSTRALLKKSVVAARRARTGWNALRVAYRRELAAPGGLGSRAAERARRRRPGRRGAGRPRRAPRSTPRSLLARAASQVPRRSEVAATQLADHRHGQGRAPASSTTSATSTSSSSRREDPTDDASRSPPGSRWTP